MTKEKKYELMTKVLSTLRNYACERKRKHELNHVLMDRRRRQILDMCFIAWRRYTPNMATKQILIREIEKDYQNKVR